MFPSLTSRANWPVTLAAIHVLCSLVLLCSWSICGFLLSWIYCSLPPSCFIFPALLWSCSLLLVCPWLLMLPASPSHFLSSCCSSPVSSYHHCSFSLLTLHHSGYNQPLKLCQGELCLGVQHGLSHLIAVFESGLRTSQIILYPTFSILQGPPVISCTSLQSPRFLKFWEHQRTECVII